MPRVFQTAALVLIIATHVVMQAHAQSRIDCDALHSDILKQQMHYCVYLPDGYEARKKSGHRYPVLYLLHGLGDNERTLFNSGGWTVLDDLKREGKMGDFLIVAPEGRRSFYINSADARFRYSDFFLHEFIPLIEKNFHANTTRTGRAITGISMGGYGALRFAFAHPEMFSAVSAQSAALVTEAPQQINLAARSGAPLMTVLTAVFGNPINVTNWNENNPFLLARKNVARIRRLAIYFNCGQVDNYGFEKGAEKLDQELTAEGVKHEYHLYPGDHSISYFLSYFAEVMEFHSRAFGLLK